MATQYVNALVDVLEACELPVPKNIRSDQKLTAHLLNVIKDAFENQEAVGTATVGDVVVGKTFSNSTKTGLVGTLVVPTLEDLTSDATATAAEIADKKTAYVNGEKLVGTKLHNRQYAFSTVTIGTALSAEDSAYLVSGAAGTHITIAHNETACKFARSGANAGDSEVYFIGGSVDTGTAASTYYTMIFTVVEGIATVTSIKDASGTEDITNWTDATGSLIMFKE